MSIPCNGNYPPRVPGKLLLAAALASGAALAYGYLVETRRPILEQIHIALPDLPEPFEGLKILLLSDFHVSRARWRQSRARDFVNRALGVPADVILMTGDYGNMPHDLPLAYPILRKLHAPLGVWAVPGNHDRDYEPGQKLRGLARPLRHRDLLCRDFATLGIHLLVNDSAFLERGGRRLYLVGLDNYIAGRADLTRALAKVPPESTAILLTHTPDAVLEAHHPPLRLALAGHTHGGQMVIPGLGPLFMPTRLGRNFASGLKWYKGMPLYITRGFSGNIGFRLNCPPELTLITLGRISKRV